jgi:serine/threonine protein kinase/formylglycine-generating enzyme required for sulfatase activity
VSDPTRLHPDHSFPTADPSSLADTHSVGEATKDPANSSAQPTSANRPSAPSGYELLEEIGSGGMGVVYHGRDTVLSRDVAVKFLQNRYPLTSLVARRFVDEAKITGQLQHPGIPPVHEVGELPDGRPFLVMKLIKGRTLADLIAEGAANRGSLVAVFEQVCQAVAYAHNRGVVHRDLKPANVMVGAFGEVQVMDWGLAKFRSETRADSAEASIASTFHDPRTEADEDLHTRAGSFLGTPAYMSPEQAIGAVDQVDERSDVFGLGALLCAILTGEPPFVADTTESTRQLAAQKKVEPAFARLNGCGAEPGLVALCKRCLAGEREERLRNAGEVASAVHAIRVEVEERARQAELETVRVEGERQKAELRAAEQHKRRRVQLLLAGVVLLVVVGGGIAASWVQAQREADRIGADRKLGDERLAAEKQRLNDLRSADEEARRKQEATRRETRAATLVQSLSSADTIGVPRLIEDLVEFHDLAGPQLRELTLQPVTTKPGLHARLALLADPGRAAEVATYLPMCKPEELLPIREFLKPCAATVAPVLWAVLSDEKADSGKRVRAASALAELTPDDPRWTKFVPTVIVAAVHSKPDEFVVWSQALEPIRGTLLPALVKHYPASRERIRSGNLDEVDLVTEVLGFDLTVNLLAKYASDLPVDLADLAMTVDPRHYKLFSEAIEKNQAAVILILKAELTKAVAPDWKDAAVESLAVRQANAAASLLKLHQPEPVWPLLQHRPDPRVRSYLIHRLGSVGADVKAIIKRLDEEPDLTIRRALLQSLGEYGEKDISLEDRKALLPKLQEMYRTATDPGIHASSEWLLRTWKEEAWLKEVNDDWAKDKEQREKRLEGIQKLLTKDKEKMPPQWYINGQGQTMVVIPGPVEFVMGSPLTEVGHAGVELQRKVKIGRTFALAASPVTKEQFLRFQPEYRHSEMRRYPDPTCPIGGVTWFEAAMYCNWLSKEEGIPEDQWCYEIKGDIIDHEIKLKANYLSLSGYRLPTEAEMEYATRAGALTSRYFGESEELLPKYAWYIKNSQERTWPVGSLKPNDLGLFDVLGNINIWCQESYRPNPRGEEVREDKEDVSTIVNTNTRVLRGSAFESSASLVRSAKRLANVPSNRYAGYGYRLARTMNP